MIYPCILYSAVHRNRLVCVCKSMEQVIELILFAFGMHLYIFESNTVSRHAKSH